MNYEKLSNFKEILADDDFNSIADKKIIGHLSKIFLYHLLLNKEVDEDKKFLKNYFNHFQKFYFNLGEHKINKLDKSYKLFQYELIRLKNLLNKPFKERSLISKNYLKKFNKNFLYSLSLLYDGLLEAFSYNHVNEMNFEKNQVVRFILDKSIGLGHKYEFNKANGRDNAVQKLFNLKKSQLQKLMVTLEKPKKDSFREYSNGWTVLGKTVRVHIVFKKLGLFFKPRIYRIYIIDSDKEHKNHSQDMKKSPEKWAFKPI